MTNWAHTLTFLNVTYTDGQFRFTYQIDGQEIEITLAHSTPTKLPDRAVQKIGVNLGMCYLVDLAEIVLPQRIRIFQKFPSEILDYWANLYENVVIEKCFQLKLPTSIKNTVWETGNVEPDATPFEVSNKRESVALCLTGGKESLAILKTLEGKKPVMLFFLNPEMNIHRRRVYAYVKDRFETIKTISNRPDVLNPLIKKYRGLASGVDMAHLVFNTMLYADSCDSVLIGNEYSSNFPNAIYEGSVVNHQYVKTIRFAEELNAYVHQFVTPDFSYHSPFFGLYEYRIADLLFKDEKYLDLWTSCNQTTNEVNFCSNCHKCAFTYLLARTKKSEEYLSQFFSRNMLEDVALFKPLMDFVGDKPLDCVGDKTEVWVALEKLREMGAASAVGDYYLSRIRPSIQDDIQEYQRTVGSSQRVPVELPADIEAIFTEALGRTLTPPSRTT